jgi:hypothetical protein
MRSRKAATFSISVWLGLTLVLSTIPTSALADGLSRATLTVDATRGAEVSIEGEFVWTAEGRQPRTTLEMYLAKAVRLTSVTADGRELATASEPVSGSDLEKWTVRLDVPLAPGTSRTLRYRAALSASSMPGIRVSGSSGYLLPGSGWFPSVSPWTAERVTHSVTFRLPSGSVGVAAGSLPGGASEVWTCTTPARPFAAWGEFERVVRTDEHPDGTATFEIYRRRGRSGDVPAFDRLTRIIDHLRTGLGAESGTGAWKIVDVGDGVVAGGQRAIFWDEGALAKSTGRERTIAERDMAGAAAASFWSENFAFSGDLAAWLSTSFDRHLGDLAVISLDTSDDRWATEALVVGSRRDAFATGQAQDRPLQGLTPTGATAAWSLETRGTLVAHLAAEVVPDRPRWMSFLAGVRPKFAGKALDWAAFKQELSANFPNQHTFLMPFLDSTDLPDFRISDHGAQEAKLKPRYRVEVENVGSVTAFAELSTFTTANQLLRTTRIQLEPGKKRAVLFADLDRMARVTVDARGMTPQVAYTDETIELQPSPEPGQGAYVPAFPFEGRLTEARAIEDFDLELDGVALENFSGYLLPYSTHHGPSGACLFGTGTVVIRPTEAKLSRSFHDAFSVTSLSFVGTELWIRFPLATWSKIEAQLHGRVDADQAVAFRSLQHQIYSFSFPTYFYDEERAQIPPPGSAVVIFTDQAGERRGVAHVAAKDGKTTMRYWDHLHNETLWEETQ